MSLEIKKGVAKLYLKAKDLRIKALYVRFKECFGRLKGVIECFKHSARKPSVLTVGMEGVQE